MNRKAVRRQADAVVTPMLTRGEVFRRAGPVWAVEDRGQVPLLFRARDQHILVLTDQRLALFARPLRRRPLSLNDLVIAKRYATFTLTRLRRARPMLQLRVRTGGDRMLVLEFRPRDRALARELSRELGPAQPDADVRAEHKRGRRKRAASDEPAEPSDEPRPDEEDLAQLLGP